MGDVISLNKFRKKKAKEETDKQASSNRVRFGRNAKTKRQDDTTRKTSDKVFEGKKITSSDEDDSDL